MDVRAHHCPCDDCVSDASERCQFEARVAALTAAIEAYHAKFQVVATCTDGDVEGHIREQMELHAVMLKLARGAP